MRVSPVPPILCLALGAGLAVGATAPQYGGYSPKRIPLRAGQYGPPTATLAWRAEPRRTLVVRASPARRARVVGRVGVRTPARNVTRLLVTGSAVEGNGTEWLRVLLSGGPAPSEGWVLRGVTRLSVTTLRVEVDLGTRRLRLLRSGAPIVQAAVSVGAPGTPTAPGRYAVREVARLGRVDGRALGPVAIALNGTTPTPNELRGNDRRLAVVGLGRNSRALLGRPVTLGTLRVSDRAALRLARYVRSGVPVDVIAAPGV